MTFSEKLSEKILKQPRFAEDLRLLVDLNIKSKMAISDNEIDSDIAIRLLQSALHFSQSSNTEHKHIAHKISSCLAQTNLKDKEQIKEALAVVWSRLGNFPMRDFAIGDAKISNLPLIPFFDIKNREFDNQVEVIPGKNILLTDFQVDVWNAVISSKLVTVTGPTSAGKSFALTRFLISYAKNNEIFTSCYVVPTRALINQVSEALHKTCNEYNLSSEDITITSVPSPLGELPTTKVIYVLTQERLQLLLEVDPDVAFTHLIIDEAQLLGDSSRGIILQQVIEQIRDKNKKTKIFFGAPFVKNPEFFNYMIDANEEESQLVQTEFSPVFQNIIFLNTKSEKPNYLKMMRMQGDGTSTDLGEYDLGQKIIDPRDSLPIIISKIGRGQKNLIYADGPAECEELAYKIAELIKDKSFVSEDVMVKRKEFSDFLKENVHEDYILAETVLFGVAFHYGKMPSIVRKTVEEYFSSNIIDYLICTSTLLHGVNFPAKNLFIKNPHRGSTQGKKNPLVSVDFWNLVGRAGRLGKDYEGNIYLVDHSTWDTNPIDGEKKKTITSSYYDVVGSHQAELFNFLREKNHPSGKKDMQVLESSFQKLLIDYNGNLLEKTLRKSLVKSEEQKIEYLTEIKSIASQLSLPKEVYQNHINISSFRQDELYKYLLENIPKKGPTYYIPKYPFHEGAKDSYIGVIRRISTKFEKNKPGSAIFYGPWMLLWINGSPLAMIIKNYHEYRLRKAKGKISIATSIRETLDLVEDDFRFRYVKFFRCYIDILKEALRNTGNQEHIDSIPNVPLFLELGASSKTMVGFIGLGLSRTTAGILNTKTPNKSMTQSECLAWIKSTNLSARGVSPICIEEIKRAIL